MRLLIMSITAVCALFLIKLCCDKSKKISDGSLTRNLCSEAPSKDKSSEAFTPKDTLDQLCDVILVVEDGKQFKAHRQVLSEASPFFEKLLNSDMKESKEGIVRLEMFNESVMRNTLEFINTGHVQILTEDIARDLIITADYLFLQNLKTLAGDVLLKTLNTSNCFSTYYFSEKYQCTELFSKTTTFIHANFIAACAANRKEFLNLSSDQLQMWISSDEINVTAEEDVFKIILAWIDDDKSQRKKYFAELFRQVRLVYVTRDFLCSDIQSNDLVKENEQCSALVEDAKTLVESKNYSKLTFISRKSLEVPVIVAFSSYSPYTPGTNVYCYFAQEDRWYKLGVLPIGFGSPRYTYHVPCRDKIYGVERSCTRPFRPCRMVSYNPYSNKCTSMAYTDDRELRQIFVTNEDKMYALLFQPCKYRELCQPSGASKPLDAKIEMCSEKKHVSFITKYKPESNSWEDISSFDHMNSRYGSCIVVKDNFVYFIGGEEWRADTKCNCTKSYVLADVDRYDLNKNQWDKAADIQVARSSATGAAANGKIFIAGGFQFGRLGELESEVFNETTNEWQFVESTESDSVANPRLLSVDDKLYVLGTRTYNRSTGIYTADLAHLQVRSYDDEKAHWNLKATIPWRADLVNCCSMRIFKGFLLDNEEKREAWRETISPSPQPFGDLSSSRLQDASLNRRQMKCLIL